MSQDPAFLFYPGDYLRDTQCLSEAVQVAYDRIMCEHMRNICISQQQLKFFTKKLSQDEIDELLMVLTQTEGGYQITWVAESISKRKAYSQSRRENRTKKTSKDINNTSKTYDKHMENENENGVDNESEVEVIKAPPEKKIDFDQIQEIFNSVCVELPKVKVLTPARKKAIEAIAKKHGLEAIGEAFRNTAESDFMNGRSKEGWTANFDWIFNSKNFLKILEGNYKNKSKSSTEAVVGRQTKETFVNNASNWEIK